jgi:hypothetical protein
LLPCFTTTDTILCPYCRCELFQVGLEDDYNSDGDNFDYHFDEHDNIEALFVAATEQWFNGLQVNLFA